MIVDWIPIDEDDPESFPKTDDYILISCSNYSLIDIGRYESDRDGDGAFYVGDESKSCASCGLFVNAWMPIIPPYREESNDNIGKVVGNVAGGSEERMTIIEIAQMLDGTKSYPSMPKEIVDLAKENGIVICHGCSDDLIELDGAIRDETGCFDGGMVYVNKSGFLKEGSEARNPIKVFWCGSCDGEKRDYEAAWEYETEIPHETFRMFDEGDLYCVGMLFYLEDVK